MSDKPIPERWLFEYRTASTNPKQLDYSRILKLIEELGAAEAALSEARDALKDAYEVLYDGDDTDLLQRIWVALDRAQETP